VKRLSKILVTAGPTRERLDDIRFISNLSTGRMGYAVADCAAKRGYKVTLISGPTNIAPPGGVKFIEIEDARQMEREVKKNIKKADCLFMTSAVCDWRPEARVHGKIKKERLGKKISIKLVKNPDILAGVSGDKDGKILIGFALESESLLTNAKKKLKAKRLDLIVANSARHKKSPFGHGKTDVTFIDNRGNVKNIRHATKKKVAKELLDSTEALWARKQ